MAALKRNSATPYLFIAPHLLFFIAFFAVPAVAGVLVSFTKWNFMAPPRWVGFANYVEILLNKESTFYFQFWNGLGNTFQFVLYSVPFIIVVPLLFAVVLSKKPKGYAVFQAVFYLPSLFSISSVMLTWWIMFNMNMGPVNGLLGIKLNWFNNQPYTWIALVWITVWWCIGSNLVIYLASIADIPQQLYEAASIDGAGPIKQFFAITLPGMRHALLFTTVMTTIAQFNIYGQPYMFTSGNVPPVSTTVLLIYIRQLAWGSGGSIAGLASAMSVMLGLCILCVSVGQYVLIRRKD